MVKTLVLTSAINSRSVFAAIDLSFSLTYPTKTAVATSQILGCAGMSVKEYVTLVCTVVGTAFNIAESIINWERGPPSTNVTIGGLEQIDGSLGRAVSLLEILALGKPASNASATANAISLLTLYQGDQAVKAIKELGLPLNKIADATSAEVSFGDKFPNTCTSS
jgi:hypothetical protein